MISLKTVQNVELVHQKMQNKHKRIFIIAGEVSGDVLGGRIMSEIPDAEFVGIGGENMQAAGLKSLFPMSDLSVMGIVEVLAHAKTLTRRIKQTVAAILEYKPDLVVTIDSPGFAKSVIKQVRNHTGGKCLIANGLRFHHVVAPQVWAWRSGRAKKYARLFDKLYAFFDFEIPYFTKYGLDTVAVGHPIADKLIGKFNNAKKTDEKVIALIPGSRMSEVKRLMPLMRDVADQMVRNGYQGYKFIIPTVETTVGYVSEEIKKWPIRPVLVPSEKRYDVYSKAYIAIAASGTVSAELAMLHVPTVVVYKMNPITMWIGRHLIHVKWVSLVNILLNCCVYPECLGADANVNCVLDAVQKLTIPSVRKNMIADLQSADSLWKKSGKGAAALIAKNILN